MPHYSPSPSFGSSMLCRARSAWRGAIGYMRPGCCSCSISVRRSGEGLDSFAFRYFLFLLTTLSALLSPPRLPPSRPDAIISFNIGVASSLVPLSTSRCSPATHLSYSTFPCLALCACRRTFVLPSSLLGSRRAPSAPRRESPH